MPLGRTCSQPGHDCRRRLYATDAAVTSSSWMCAVVSVVADRPQVESYVGMRANALHNVSLKLTAQCVNTHDCSTDHEAVIMIVLRQTQQPSQCN